MMMVDLRRFGLVIVGVGMMVSSPAYAQQDRTWSEWWAGKGNNPADAVMAASGASTRDTRMQSGLVVQDPSTMSEREMQIATDILEQRTQDIKDMKAKIAAAGARANAAWMAQDNVVRQKQAELARVKNGLPVATPTKIVPKVQEPVKKVVIRPNAVPVQEWDAINRANAAAKITQQQNKPAPPAPVVPTTPVTPGAAKANQ